MPAINFSLEDLQHNFSSKLLAMGKFLQSKKVLCNLTIDEQHSKITATIKGKRRDFFHISINFKPDKLDPHRLQINADCSCMTGFNCEHAACVLYDLLEKQQAFEKKSPLRRQEEIESPLLQQFDQAWIAAPSTQEEVATDLLYLLNFVYLPTEISIQVKPIIAKHLKSGGYSRGTFIKNPQQFTQFFDEDDEKIFAELAQKSYLPESDDDNIGYVLTQNSGDIIKKIVHTNRCYWSSQQGSILNWNEARDAFFSKQIDNDGKINIHARIHGSNAIVLPTAPLLYIDLTNNQCGFVTVDGTNEIAEKLMHAITSSSSSKKSIDENLSLKQIKYQKKAIQPTAKIVLFGQKHTDELLQTTIRPCIDLIFCYEQFEIPLDEKRLVVPFFDDDTLIDVERNLEVENQFSQQLKTIEHIQETNIIRYVQTKKTSSQMYHHPIFFIEETNLLNPHKNALAFLLEKKPLLIEQGWQIEVQQSFPTHYVSDEEDWYSAVSDSKQTGWFNLEVGVQVQGQSINVLPLLVNLLQKHGGQLAPEVIDSLSFGDKLFLQLQDGRFLPIAIDRVKSILAILIELTSDSSLKKDEQLLLPYVRAGDIVALQRALGACRMRWLSGERLQNLAQKLHTFKGIQTVELPEIFKADLRPYQHQGLNWLQFLRDYELAGVLADDMGLGKTVQTLAHLVIEQAQGRMQHPSLIVAPTSLVINWFKEAERFAPTLKVLVLHGETRKKHFENFSQYDVIITTYPLLIRDHAFLLHQQFYFLILDEAQIIKNPQAKATQIILQLNAEHRLCLTGTPLENHLGELWSLFNFLLPGLLGDQRTFRKVFRTPIEKMQNTERQTLLKQRISPFLLRRTKDAVASELPKKTEAVRNLELTKDQRELYENIRIAMQAKVMHAVKTLGFAKSRIIILDALLKLRQVCCDPRLVKLPMANQTNESAKLELLQTMLPSMIEEGRRILLFSSFATMLDLIEEECKKLSIPYAKLTGKTVDREKPIQAFQEGHVPLFLISLKAGGVGLNLTKADVVIHYDPWWNPAAEDQATDRAHRIGQDKPVFVYKLITTGTVEEKIIAMQNKKRALMDSLFQTTEQTDVSLKLEDLEYLFQPLS